MNTLTVFPPNYQPVTLAVQKLPWSGYTIVCLETKVPYNVQKWICAEGFVACMLGEISEDIVFESSVIDEALSESENGLV